MCGVWEYVRVYATVCGWVSQLISLMLYEDHLNAFFVAMFYKSLLWENDLQYIRFSTNYTPLQLTILPLIAFLYFMAPNKVSVLVY